MRFLSTLLLCIYTLAVTQAISWSGFKKKASGFVDDIIDKAQDIWEDDDISIATTTLLPLQVDKNLKDQATKWRELAEGVLQCDGVDSLGQRSRRAAKDGISEMLEGLAKWIGDMSDDMDNYKLTSFERETQRYDRSHGGKLSNLDFDPEPVDLEVFSASSKKNVLNHKKQNFWKKFQPEPKPTDEPPETPDYSVLCLNEDYEVRRYNTSIWVSTSVTDFSRQLAGIRAFRRLYKYISGDNTPGVTMPMTVPVKSRVDTTCSPFELFKKYTYSFYLPHEFWDNIPAPTNKQIFIEQLPEQTFYVTTFGGYLNSWSVTHHIDKLQNALDDAQEPYANDRYFTSGYDAPKKLFDRRNEIWIPLNTSVSDEPMCLESGPTTPTSLEHCEDVKCPQYEVLDTLDEGVELRRYTNLTIVIKKSLTCDFEVALSDSYDPVQWYFEGYNSRKQRIEHMAPVLFSVDRPLELPENCEAVYQTSFIAPANMYGNLPKPIDDSLTIEHIDSLDVFVYTFGGYLTDEPFSRYQTLREIVGSRCIQEYPFALAGYDSPKNVLNRRNEVWIASSSGCQENATKEAPITTNVTAVVTNSNMTFVTSPVTTDNMVQPPSFTALPEVVMHIQPLRRFKKIRTGSIVNAEGPDYNTLRTVGQIEVRTYNQGMWISTIVNATSLHTADKVAYRKIKSYISSHNKQGHRIASVTAPFICRFDPQESGLTTYKFSHFLAKEFWDSYPEPLDNTVFIERIPESTYYVLSSTGVMLENVTFYNLINNMKNYLNEAKENFTEEYLIIAGFDGYSCAVSIKKEIWIPVEGSIAGEVGKSEEADVFPTNQCTGNECPVYEVLKEYENGDIELRHYPNLTLVVKRSTACNYSSAVRESYMSLHNYFNGSNLLNMKIPRTAPVIIRVDRPGHRPADCDAVYEIAYVAPDNYKYQLPDPIDELIYFDVYKSLEVFTYTFGGYMANDTFKEYNQLKAVLDVHCVKEYPFILAGYSSPWQTVDRKNEVWLTHTPTADCSRHHVRNDKEKKQTAMSIPQCIAGTSCPSYEFVAMHGKMEERVYKPSKWVCSQSTTCSIELATSNNFQRLSLYMSGTGNMEGKKILTTTSFILKMYIDELDILSCKKKYEMCFYLPDDIIAPTPTNTNVSIRKDEEHVVYTYPFAGYATSKKFKRIANKALQGVDKLGLARRDYLYIAQYSSPSSPSKYNEIWLVKNTETI